MDVFLSRPTWIDERYDRGLKAFTTRLTDLGLRPRTLGTTDYPVAAPLDEVLAIMDECKACVVLGYPQMLFQQGLIKARQIDSAVALATEWNHIEAALAYARKMPLLLIHDTGISRGVFDHGVLAGFVYSLDLSDAAWCHSDQISGALRSWKARAEAYTSVAVVPAPSVPAPPPKDAVACPNCSRPGAPFFLMKLPSTIARHTGNTHHCTKCKGQFDYK